MNKNKFKKINGKEGSLYLIRKYDNVGYNGSVYHLIKIKRFEDKGYLCYDIVDTLIPLQPSQYFNDKNLEQNIFSHGRSKSTHDNVIHIYENFGVRFSIESNKVTLNGVSNFNKYFLQKYEVNINYVLDGYTFKKKYARRLSEDFFDTSKFLINDIDYDKNCDVTRFTLEFFNELKKLVNIGNVSEVQWYPNEDSFIVALKLYEKIIYLHGLNAGYGGEGPRGLMSILIECGFNNSVADKVLSSNKCFVKKEDKI